jgi:hypothetical protein
VIQLVDPEIAITGGWGASGTCPAVQEELVALSLVTPMQPTCSRRRLWNAPSYSASALHGPSRRHKNRIKDNAGIQKSNGQKSHHLYSKKNQSFHEQVVKEKRG